MQKKALFSALIIGMGVMWSPMAFASGDDLFSMYNFERSACVQDPAQAGCYGFTPAQPATMPTVPHTTHATHHEHMPKHG